MNLPGERMGHQLQNPIELTVPETSSASNNAAPSAESSLQRRGCETFAWMTGSESSAPFSTAAARVSMTCGRVTEGCLRMKLILGTVVRMVVVVIVNYLT